MGNPDIKMIGFDLDGTLLTSGKELSEYTKEILREATAGGNQEFSRNPVCFNCKWSQGS